MPLPEGERVGCEVVPEVGYVGMGAHHGGLDSTILLGGDNLSAYYYGWHLLDSRVDFADLVRRLLTEQVLPVDLV